MSRKSDKKWLEEKLKGLDPELREMIKQVWKCDSIDDVERLVEGWYKKGLFAKKKR